MKVVRYEQYIRSEGMLEVFYLTHTGYGRDHFKVVFDREGWKCINAPLRIPDGQQEQMENAAIAVAQQFAGLSDEDKLRALREKGVI